MNKGVNCNVCNCKYNKDGCKCSKETITISQAKENSCKKSNSFCESFKEQ